MAVNTERSMNHDLMLGATGRSHHRLTPERGGQVETEWPIRRAQQYMVGSWSPVYLQCALDELSGNKDALEDQMFDCTLRDRISIITGNTARTRPVARNQFEANPFPTPLDTTHTDWPNSY